MPCQVPPAVPWLAPITLTFRRRSVNEERIWVLQGLISLLVCSATRAPGFGHVQVALIPRSGGDIDIVEIIEGVHVVAGQIEGEPGACVSSIQAIDDFDRQALVEGAALAVNLGGHIHNRDSNLWHCLRQERFDGVSTCLLGLQQVSQQCEAPRDIRG